MFAGHVMMISIGVGGMISLVASLVIIWKTRADGGGWAEMKTPLYYAQTALAFGLVGAGVAKAILPPQHLSLTGLINPAVTSADARDRGFHCLAEIDGQLQHPAIAEKVETFKTRFTSRDRMSITGYSISPVSLSGVAKGFHIYSIHYDHMHYKSGEKIPIPKKSARTYWVAHNTCDAELRGDSQYGIFDPLSFINLNDWFNS